jgi:hypothetical protein
MLVVVALMLVLAKTVVGMTLDSSLWTPPQSSSSL